MGKGQVPPARQERVNYHASVRMQDLREHIVESLRRSYPKNLSTEDYYEIADKAIDEIIEQGETLPVHDALKQYGVRWATDVLITEKGSIVSKI